MNDIERFEAAVACRDCESIPKDRNAAMVLNSPAGEYQVMHNGIRVYVDSHYGSYNTEVIRRLKGHHEPQEERVFNEVLKTIPSNG